MQDNELAQLLKRVLPMPAPRHEHSRKIRSCITIIGVFNAGRSGSTRPFMHFMPHFGDHGSIHGRNSAAPPVRCVCGSAYLMPGSGGKVSLMNFRNSMAVACHGISKLKGTGKLVWTRICRNIKTLDCRKTALLAKRSSKHFATEPCSSQTCFLGKRCLTNPCT